jgi:hypothetical protein
MERFGRIEVIRAGLSIQRTLEPAIWSVLSPA